MHPGVITVVDKRRGCGWRKEGGLYLVGGGEFMSCGKLPLPIEKPCPVCGSGLRVSRGLQKINWARLTADVKCDGQCSVCLAAHTEIAYLMSVGEKFYPKPSDFMDEAMEQGISKRIATKGIPRDFKVGSSVVALAHKKAIIRTVQKPPEHVEAGTLFEGQTIAVVPEPEVVYEPGIFTLFRPTSLEYVVKLDDSDEKIERLIKRGVTPVQVVREVQLEIGVDLGTEDQQAKTEAALAQEQSSEDDEEGVW